MITIPPITIEERKDFSMRIKNDNVNFTGSIHQLNRLSKKISGKPADIHLNPNGVYEVYLNKLTWIKDNNNGDIAWIHGTGKTPKAAAKNFLDQVKNGCTVVADKVYPPINRKEVSVKAGKQGLEMKVLRNSD